MVIPVHPNPLVREGFDRELRTEPRVKLIGLLSIIYEMVASLSVSYLNH